MMCLHATVYIAILRDKPLVLANMLHVEANCTNYVVFCIITICPNAKTYMLQFTR